MNSAAVRDPSLLARCRRSVRRTVHRHRDRREAHGRTSDGWEVYVDAGRTADRARRRRVGADATAEHGAGEVLLTSMDRDGTGEGYDLELLAAVSDATSVPLVASGGAGDGRPLRRGPHEGRADAVLAASRFHFEELTIADVKRSTRRARDPRQADVTA